MTTYHSLEDLKRYHQEATGFFAAQLMLLKEGVPTVTDERLAKAAVLLISCGQTGAALLQLASQTDRFTNESVMLARSFIEKVINFCYAGVCDEKEYRAFILHPVYKHYHLVASPNMFDDADFTPAGVEARTEKQKKLKELPIVQEALEIFSETKEYLSWTNKTLGQRISVIQERGKVLDVFFTVSKLQYYSDASEALHGSLYGCTFNVGVFDPDFDHTNSEQIEKKLLKNSTCVLLHVGMLIHEAFTLISYSSDINDIWDHSYQNRGHALNLLLHVVGRNPEVDKMDKNIST